MASITITTTPAEDQRIVVAYGHILGFGRNATGAEVKSALIAHLTNAVRSDETDVAYRALLASQPPISPT